MTPTEILDWASPYMKHNVANDGFKAEMVWLAHLYGLGDHPALDALFFVEPDMLALAAYWFPDKYQSDWDYVDVGRKPYADLQARSVDALVNGRQVPEYAPQPDETNIFTVHRALWACKFGETRIQAPADPKMVAALASPDDNEHVMACLGLFLTGNPVEWSRLDQIAGLVRIEPTNYHAILVALVCQNLRGDFYVG